MESQAVYKVNSIAEITLIRVTLHCPKCHNEWGIKAYSVEELLEAISQTKRLVCFNCKFGNADPIESKGDNYGYKEK